MTTLDEAVAVLEAGSRDDVITMLLGLSSSDRKTLGPTFRGWLTRGWTVKASADRLAVAVVATAAGVRQALVACDVHYGMTNEVVDDVVEVLAARRPEWLPELVGGALTKEHPLSWRLARAIVRQGLVAVPDDPAYYRGTVRGLPYNDLGEPLPLVAAFETDPTLVGPHLIAMLSTEGVGRLLALHDNFFYKYRKEDAGGTWRVAFLALSRQGRLDRTALLDAVVAAPLRDWPAADIGWYVDLHEALEPTSEEVVARQASYARLLAAEHGPSVKAAQRQLSRILTDRRLEPEPVVDASRATLGRNDKSTVAGQLRLLERLHRARPDAAVVDVVSVAVEHPRPDVREEAVRLLARLGVVTDEPQPAARFRVPPPTAGPAPAPIEQISDVDELADVLLALFAQVDAIETERAVDGLLRMAQNRPRAADVLLERATSSDFWSRDPGVVPALLARAWLAPAPGPNDVGRHVVLGHTWNGTPAARDTLVGFLGRRLTDVVRHIQSRGGVSVALPSTTDGSLDAGLLSRRLADAARAGVAPSELELAVALLRVPQADRPSVAIPAAVPTTPGHERLLAATPPVWERQIYPHQPMWRRQATSIPLFADVTGRAGDALDGLLARRRPTHTISQEVGYGEYFPRFDEVLALAALLLPHETDVLAAHAHPFLHGDLSANRAVSVPVIDAISRARTSGGAPQASALVLALSAKDVRARAAAHDALLDLARPGLLDGTALGHQAALHLTDDIVVGQRLAAGLIEVSRADEAAVLPVLDALQEIMPALPGRRDARTFVDLAADLAQRTGRRPRLPDEFRDMASGTSSSLLARSARRLL